MTSEQFEKYVSKARPAAVRFLYRHECYTSDIEDLLSEAVCKAWKFRDKFHSEWYFTSWFIQILKNVLLDFIRYKRVRVTLVGVEENLMVTFEDSRPNPEQVLCNEIHMSMAHIIKSMSPRQGKAIQTLVKYGGDQKLARGELGINDTTFRSLIYQARRHIDKFNLIDPRTRKSA